MVTFALSISNQVLFRLLRQHRNSSHNVEHVRKGLRILHTSHSYGEQNKHIKNTHINQKTDQQTKEEEKKIRKKCLQDFFTYEIT